MLPSRSDGAFQVHRFDAAYLERLRAGDAATEKHFAEYFGALVLLKLRRRLRSRELIDDVRQETFLRVLRAVREGGIREAGGLGAFVCSVCNNVLKELVRKEGRVESHGEDAEARRSPGLDPEDTLISKETVVAVRRVIRALPERDQEILRTLFLDEKGRDEICARFGVDRGYLRVLLHRAKNQFRARQLEEVP